MIAILFLIWTILFSPHKIISQPTIPIENNFFSLKISEENLQINVDKWFWDATYKISNHDNVKNIFIYPTSIAQKYLNCNNWQFWPSLTKIYWSPNLIDQKNNDNYYSTKITKQFSWYFIVLEMPQSPCSDETKDIQYEVNFVENIKNNFETLQEIKKP